MAVTDANNKQIASVQGILSYSSTNKNFQGNIRVPNLASGQYILQIKMDEFLTKTVPGIISVSANGTVVVPSVSVITGDINNDNKIDILDYNSVVGCFGSKQQTSSCTAPITQQSAGADINDDGTVDGGDYNLFLRELSVQRGQ